MVEGASYKKRGVRTTGEPVERCHALFRTDSSWLDMYETAIQNRVKHTGNAVVSNHYCYGHAMPVVSESLRVEFPAACGVSLVNE